MSGHHRIFNKGAFALALLGSLAGIGTPMGQAIAVAPTVRPQPTFAPSGERIHPGRKHVHKKPKDARPKRRKAKARAKQRRLRA